MNRRGFIGSLTGFLAAAATLDTEKLLWTPGAKTIFIPKAIVPPPSLIVGVAVNGIRAGDYGFVQVSGPVMTSPECQQARRRSIVAVMDMDTSFQIGQFVYADQVDLGAYPLMLESTMEAHVQ